MMRFLTFLEALEEMKKGETCYYQDLFKDKIYYRIINGILEVCINTKNWKETLNTFSELCTRDWSIHEEPKKKVRYYIKVMGYASSLFSLKFYNDAGECYNKGFDGVMFSFMIDPKTHRSYIEVEE